MNPIQTVRSKFSPGQVVATPGALEAMRASGQSPQVFLGAHLEGFWGGELDEEDRRLNDEALTDGSRLLSAYRTLRGTRPACSCPKNTDYFGPANRRGLLIMQAKLPTHWALATTHKTGEHK
jgi:hypothetical protein